MVDLLPLGPPSSRADLTVYQIKLGNYMLRLTDALLLAAPPLVPVWAYRSILVQPALPLASPYTVQVGDQCQ